MLVHLDYQHVFDDADATDHLRETAEHAASEFPGVALEFKVTGQVPAAIAAIEAHESNQLKYQAIAYGMILLLSMVLFRGITAVVVVAIAPVFGVFWTMGFIRYFEFQMNPFNDVVLPVLVALV